MASEGNEIEKIPDCNIFCACFNWTLEHMLTVRDFESWIDQEFAKMKHHAMQVYRDYGPPPKFFPNEKEEI